MRFEVFHAEVRSKRPVSPRATQDPICAHFSASSDVGVRFRWRLQCGAQFRRWFQWKTGRTGGKSGEAPLQSAQPVLENCEHVPVPSRGTRIAVDVDGQKSSLPKTPSQHPSCRQYQGVEHHDESREKGGSQSHHGRDSRSLPHYPKAAFSLRNNPSTFCGTRGVAPW